MPGMRRQYCIWEAGQEILLRDLQKQVQQQENEENQGDEKMSELYERVSGRG